MSSIISDTKVEQWFRRFLLSIVGFMFVGTTVELILAKHNQEPLQAIPFILCAAGLIAVLAALFRPQRGSIMLLRVVMIVIILGSVVGVVLHLHGNLEFEQEIRPTAATSDSMLKALQGAAPLLAPGVLALASALALGATYYHPALGKRDSL